MNDKEEAAEWVIHVPKAKAALQPSHLRQPPSWVAYMRELDADWRRYMCEHDAPADRLASKVDQRFRLDP